MKIGGRPAKYRMEIRGRLRWTTGHWHCPSMLRALVNVSNHSYTFIQLWFNNKIIMHKYECFSVHPVGELSFWSWYIYDSYQTWKFSTVSLSWLISLFLLLLWCIWFSPRRLWLSSFLFVPVPSLLFTLGTTDWSLFHHTDFPYYHLCLSIETIHWI